MTEELTEIIIAESEAFFLKRIDSDILHFQYHDNIVITIEHVQEAFDLYVKHSVENSMKVLLSFGPFASINTDARLYAEKKVMPTPAQAIILKNLSQRILAKFYHLFRKDKHPLKFFSEIEPALEWLNNI